MDSILLLSASDPRPMYQQIIDQITTRVMAGDWAPGQALPSIRELAASCGVSLITVKRAYEELEAAGVILTRHGKGSVVAERPDLARRLLQQELARHLAAAADSGHRLGLERSELHRQLEAALDARGLPPTPDEGPAP